MTEFVLVFPYQGQNPGDVIQVEDGDVLALVRAGIGRPKGTTLKRHLGRLPRVEPPIDTMPVKIRDGEPRTSRTSKTTRNSQESTDN